MQDEFKQRVRFFFFFLLSKSKTLLQRLRGEKKTQNFRQQKEKETFVYEYEIVCVGVISFSLFYLLLKKNVSRRTFCSFDFVAKSACLFTLVFLHATTYIYTSIAARSFCANISLSLSLFSFFFFASSFIIFVCFTYRVLIPNRQK